MESLAALLDIKVEEGIPSKQTTRISIKKALLEQLSMTPKGSHRRYPFSVVTPGYMQFIVSIINKRDHHGKQEYVAMKNTEKEITYVWRNL